MTSSPVIQTPANRGSALMIVENLPLPFDRRVWMESTTLAECGWTVVGISPKTERYPEEEEVVEGIRILRYDLPPERSSVLGYLREYAAALWGQLSAMLKLHRRGHRFDVIHVCNPPDLGFIPALLGKLLWGSRYVFDHHDLSPELFESKFGQRGVLYWLLRAVERMNFFVADLSIATNESYKSVAVRRGKMVPDSVFVVRSGPSLARFLTEKPSADYRRGAKWLVGYVGVMGEFDGLDHLLPAARHLIQEMGERAVRFCLIGDGPVRTEWERWVMEHGLEPWVEFTGRVPDQELRQRLASCDVCVDPDPPGPLNSVSTMNKVLEYMAMGKPMAMYRLPEGERSAGDGAEYADGFEPEDLARAVHRLLRDPDLRSRRGAIGRHRIETELSWEHQAPKLVRAYERALGNGCP